MWNRVSFSIPSTVGTSIQIYMRITHWNLGGLWMKAEILDPNAVHHNFLNVLSNISKPILANFSSLSTRKVASHPQNYVLSKHSLNISE